MHAKSTKVKGGWHLAIEKWRRKNSSGNHNLVHFGRVVRVGFVSRHEPEAFVNSRANKPKRARCPVNKHRLAISKESVRFDIDQSVTDKWLCLCDLYFTAGGHELLPPVIKPGILATNQGRKRIDFEESFCFGGCVHPLHILKRKTT
jgi:hypothetical protein